MVNEERNMKKTYVSWLFVLITGILLLLNPVSAAGVNVPVPHVDPGTYIFVGESGLDITGALDGKNYVGWWAGGHDIKTTPADIIIGIGGTAGNYYVDPAVYTQEGPYHLCDGGGNAILYGGNEKLAFVVEKPRLSIVPVDDICPDVNRTGQVFLGTNLSFNIVTNLYHIQNRNPAPPNGIFDINVIGSNGKNYNFLINPAGFEQPLKDIDDIDAETKKWETWNTSGLDPVTGQLYTPAGTYQISITCWANNILDHTTGAVSATTTISLVTETVDVSVNPGTIPRTSTATATVVGKPRTEYIIGIIECPLKMTGEVCDRPPWIKEDPYNPALYPFDPEGGPYPIGNTVVYPSCCDGLTFRDVVPHVYKDGVRYYAKIITDCNGTATIDIESDNTVWKADDNPVYTIHVQKVLPETDGVYLNDDAELTITKGDISIQISLASDETNTPISEAFIGDVLKVAGANTDSKTTYLYMTGPCQPECGGGLLPDPYPHGSIGSGPEVVPVLLPQVEGFDWIFTNPDGTGKARFWETGYLPINPGTYIIYAISKWPMVCPECLDCGGEVCFIEDCPNCDVYAIGTITLKAPELTAITEDIERCCCPGYPCGNTNDGQPIKVSGISTGNPEKKLNVWLLGKGKIGDVKYINKEISVNCDGTFTFDVVKDLLVSANTTLCRIDAGTYDLIIQDPGYNHQFDVIHEDALDPYWWAKPVEVNKKWILSGFPDIGPFENYDVTRVVNPNPNNDYLTHIEIEEYREPAPDTQRFYDDDWRKLVQVEGPGYKLGTEVLHALIRGLDDPNVDDNYVHIQFTVSDKSCLVGTDFDADRTYGNKPLTVRFTDKSYQATSWLWNFGDGSTSTEQNPVHTFTEEGRYTVSLTTNGDDKGKAVKNDYIRVAKGPTAKFTFAPGDVSVGTDVQFTDLSSGNPTSWMWQFDDGSTSSLQSPVHTYLTPGVYTVTLTVSDENGISGESAIQTIKVQGSSTPVVADFRTEVTSGTIVQFIDLSSGFGINSWIWDFGDGSTSTERNPKHTYLKEGTYQVSLTVSNGNFENTAIKTIGIR